MLRVSLDLRTKLTGLAFALVLTVVCGLTAYLCACQVYAAEASLKSRALGYTRVVAQEAASAIAFDDTETAREVLEAASLDPDVHAIFLYRADGTVLGGIGEPGTAPRAVDVLTLQRQDKLISVIAPVVSREGPRGTLVFEVSTTRIENVEARGLRGGMIAGGLALALGLVVSRLIGGSFAKRVRRIQQATQAFAKGRLDEPPITDDSHDEIGQLAGAFNTMSARIRDLVEVIASDGREEAARLDAIVVARTAELRTKNDDLAFLLQHVDQGFVAVDRSGQLRGERSAILERWFGAPVERQLLWDYIARRDRDAGRWLALSWEAMFEDALPLELVLDQLPKEIRHEGATFGIRYQPIGAEGLIEKVIVVISDISDEIARRRAEAAQQELAAVFGHFVAAPTAIEEFMVEGAALVTSVKEWTTGKTDLSVLKRSLHTLKGNAAFVGLARLSSLCHDLETLMCETGEPPAPKAIARLDALWTELVTTMEPYVQGRGDRVSLSREELGAHEAAIRDGVSREALLADLEGWLLEPTRPRLERAAEQARAVAARLEKSELVVVVEDNHVRLDPDRWAPFWAAFVHVIRNAVDHGIEESAVRTDAGKLPAGRLVLRSLETSCEHIIEVADDGGGIDWVSLRRRGVEAGWPSDASVIDILFADGISTKSEVTEMSGRGIGLAACRAACEALGGSVVVESQRGVGTTFRFHVPREMPRQSTPPLATALLPPSARSGARLSA